MDAQTALIASLMHDAGLRKVTGRLDKAAFLLTENRRDPNQFIANAGSWSSDPLGLLLKSPAALSLLCPSLSCPHMLFRGRKAGPQPFLLPSMLFSWHERAHWC